MMGEAALLEKVGFPLTALLALAPIFPKMNAKWGVSRAAERTFRKAKLRSLPSANVRDLGRCLT